VRLNASCEVDNSRELGVKRMSIMQWAFDSTEPGVLMYCAVRKMAV
jgi:hypothetical protein